MPTPNAAVAQRCAILIPAREIGAIDVCPKCPENTPCATIDRPRYYGRPPSGWGKCAQSCAIGSTSNFNEHGRPSSSRPARYLQPCDARQVIGRMCRRPSIGDPAEVNGHQAGPDDRVRLAHRDSCCYAGCARGLPICHRPEAKETRVRRRTRRTYEKAGRRNHCSGSSGGDGAPGYGPAQDRQVGDENGVGTVETIDATNRVVTLRSRTAPSWRSSQGRHCALRRAQGRRQGQREC